MTTSFIEKELEKNFAPDGYSYMIIMDILQKAREGLKKKRGFVNSTGRFQKHPEGVVVEYSYIKEVLGK